ncbi:MAG: phosphate signaling complex protein PhoU [Dysgonamonadaceae bacterium]|jgi:phosphate transport system protein|nr:phosphate signaling complex protein PhoU [Dysgonamonadaceae bacterium]
MKHAEKELASLKDEIGQMWRLVLSQLEKAKRAYLDSDVELAREIASREKRVNSFELKIDSDCENCIALYNPVAIDLRLVLSMMKISIMLERIGDFADAIAKYIIRESGAAADDTLKAELRVEAMLEAVTVMLADSYAALDTENTKLSGRILAQDEVVDEIYHDAVPVLAEAIRSGRISAEYGLKTMLIIRKIERIGDHCSNIVEEIVFYIDAKVLKHSKSAD